MCSTICSKCGKICDLVEDRNGYDNVSSCCGANVIVKDYEKHLRYFAPRIPLKPTPQNNTGGRAAK